MTAQTAPDEQLLPQLAPDAALSLTLLEAGYARLAAGLPAVLYEQPVPTLALRDLSPFGR